MSYNISKSSVNSALESSNAAFGDNPLENGGSQFPLELASPPLEMAPEIVMNYISINVPNIAHTNYLSQTVNISLPCGPRTGAIMGGTLYAEIDLRLEIPSDDLFFPSSEVVNRAPVTDILSTVGDVQFCDFEGTSTVVIPPSIKRKLPRFMCGTSESLKASETTRINETSIPIGTHNHILQQARMSLLGNDEDKTITNMRFHSKYAAGEYADNRSIYKGQDGKFYTELTVRMGLDSRFFASNIRAFPTCILNTLEYSFTLPNFPQEIFDPRYIVPRAIYINKINVNYIRLQLGDVVETQLTTATNQKGGAIEFFTYHHQPVSQSAMDNYTLPRNIPIKGKRVKSIESVLYTRVDKLSMNANKGPQKVCTALSTVDIEGNVGKLQHYSYATPSIEAINNILPGFENGSGVYGCVGDLPAESIVHVDQNRFNETSRYWQSGLTHHDSKMKALGRSMHEVPTADTLNLTKNIKLGTPQNFMTIPNIISYNLEGTKNPSQYYQGYSVSNGIDIEIRRKTDDWNKMNHIYNKYRGRKDLRERNSDGPLLSLKNYWVAHPTIHTQKQNFSFDDNNILMNDNPDCDDGGEEGGDGDGKDDGDNYPVPYIFSKSPNTIIKEYNSIGADNSVVGYKPYLNFVTACNNNNKEALNVLDNISKSIERPENMNDMFIEANSFNKKFATAWEFLFPGINCGSYNTTSSSYVSKSSDAMRQIINGSASRTGDTTDMSFIMPCVKYTSVQQEDQNNLNSDLLAIAYLLGFKLFTIHNNGTGPNVNEPVKGSIDGMNRRIVIGVDNAFALAMTNTSSPSYSKVSGLRYMMSLFPFKKFEAIAEDDDISRYISSYPENKELVGLNKFWYITLEDFETYINNMSMWADVEFRATGGNMLSRETATTITQPEYPTNIGEFPFLLTRISAATPTVNHLDYYYKTFNPQINTLKRYLYKNIDKEGIKDTTIDQISMMGHILPHASELTRTDGTPYERLTRLARVCKGIHTGIDPNLEETHTSITARRSMIRLMYDYGITYVSSILLDNSSSMFNMEFITPIITSTAPFIKNKTDPVQYSKRSMQLIQDRSYNSYGITNYDVTSTNIIHRILNSIFDTKFKIISNPIDSSSITAAAYTVLHLTNKPLGFIVTYLDGKIKGDLMMGGDSSSLTANISEGTHVDKYLPIDIAVTKTEYIFVTFPTSISFVSGGAHASVTNR